jgi:hypothetical protein
LNYFAKPGGNRMNTAAVRVRKGKRGHGGNFNYLTNSIAKSFELSGCVLISAVGTRGLRVPGGNAAGIGEPKTCDLPIDFFILPSLQK